MKIEEIKNEIKTHLDKEGKLLRYPSKRKAKLLSLLYLATKFEPEVLYTEAEVNQIINQWHSFQDPCMLRRDLYNLHILDRKKDGSQYWREKEQLELEEEFYIDQKQVKNE